MIKNFSLIMRGEALGHGMFVDKAMLEQVVASGNDKGPNGLKSRMAHPQMSADSIGTFLGNVHDMRLEGDKVLGDLHFAQAAKRSPKGDLPALYWAASRRSS